jgi:hypothetical protein
MVYYLNLKNKPYIPIVPFGYIFGKCMDDILLYLPIFEVESPRVVCISLQVTLIQHYHIKNKYKTKTVC